MSLPTYAIETSIANARPYKNNGYVEAAAEAAADPRQESLPGKGNYEQYKRSPKEQLQRYQYRANK